MWTLFVINVVPAASVLLPTRMQVYPVMGKTPGYCNSKLLAVFIRAMKVGNF